MPQAINVQGIPRRRTGWRLVALVVAALVIIGAVGWLIWFGRGWNVLPLPRKADQTSPVKFDAFINGDAGTGRMGLPEDTEAKRREALLMKRLEDQDKMMAKFMAEWETMKKGKTSTTTPRQDTKAAVPKVPKIVTTPRTTAVYYQRTEALPDALNPELSLIPDTAISCASRSAFNSDVPGIVSAIVTTDVKDSATLRTVLIPQGTDIQLTYGKQRLVYGEEAVAIESAKLSFPNGKTMEFTGHVGVDPMGRMGWRGRVNHHYLRLLGAVLIRGVLRGSAQTIQSGLSAIPGGGIVGGIVQDGSRVGQQQTQPWINASPTIEKDGGDRCTILLVDPLTLPPYTEGIYASR